jgi:hypothetical protein
MAIAEDVFSQVAAFMDDPERDIMTDSYLAPFLNLCNQRLYQNVFANPNIQGAKFYVVLPNIPAGTNSLKPYMADGMPLAMLTNIFSMKEKPSGTNDGNYREMRLMQDLPVPVITDERMFNGFYVPIQEDILLPGASQVLDIKIFGEFKPLPIIDGNTPILPNTEQILTHWVCEIVGMTRGATPTFISFHGGERIKATDELFNALIMDIQSIPYQQRPFNNQSNWFGTFNTGGF